MKILVGHANMDMDCFGSMVMARYLYPDHLPVRSRLIHPVARNMYHIYKKRLDFMPSRELKGQTVSEMVVFDTRSYSRVREYMDFVSPWKGDVIIYDHHLAETSDIPGALVYEAPYGSNTTLVVEKLMEKGISIHKEDATIALTGIYADTGNFTHDNVHQRDFEAAAWLCKQGANRKLMREFLKVLKQDYQIDLFHQLLNSAVYKTIHGHPVLFCYLYLPELVNGLAGIIEKIFEVENTDALFGIICFEKENRTLLVGRSQKDEIDIHEIMKTWGGGGHPRAGSATIKKRVGNQIYDEFLTSLEETLEPAVNAADLMTKDVCLIEEYWTLLEASLFLEEKAHTGAPVVNKEGILTGLLTLRDISKARKANHMHAKVSGYMTHKVYNCTPKCTLHDVERLFLKYNVGHIPVVEEERVVGIVTRSDYLRYMD